jgi:putative ABC transport system permease protein
MLTVTVRPPLARGRAVTVPPWTAAMDATMARPSPVLERHQEIGLRRALGATRGQIRAQFLGEAILLSLIGGTAGVAIGAVATAAYARSHHEVVVIRPQAWAGGLAAAIVIGALAGLLPAIRSARLSPTQALLTV